ncbi:MAG: hypothetical protein WCM93_11060, partial [Bacteroidota bacterium]
MKYKYFNFGISNTLKCFLLITALLTGSAFFANAQVRVPFTQRTSQYSPSKVIYNIRGDFQMIGNTNLTLVTYGNNTTNGNNQMKLVDMDGIASTANSSSATLALSTENGATPSCSNIIYAGLYWSGRTSSSVTTATKRSIKLKGPGQAAYQSFTANANDIRYPGDDYMYSAYIEVTDLVRLHGVGEYWVADMALSTGIGGAVGYYGGWGMVVVYENSKMKWRDVTVFDGYAYVQSGTYNYELPVSGFHTAQIGAVNMKLGLMAGEGDVNYSGDYFQIRDYTNTNWIGLSHAGNSTNNFFNSSIFTGGNARNPNLQNNSGIDVSMFNIQNTGNSVITNNQTSTTFKYGSTIDTYIIYSIAMAVDAYIPNPEGTTTVYNIGGVPPGNPMIALPGQDIQLTLDIRNKGTEAINNTQIVVPIPFATKYDTCWRVVHYTPGPTPNNLYFNPSLGANGSIIWNYGTLPLPADPNTILATLTYKLEVTDDCILLSNPNCVPVININGTISGTGSVSNASFTNVGFIRGYEYSGICAGEPITTPTQIGIDATSYVAENCQDVPTTMGFVFCNAGSYIPITEVSSAFPSGSRFYSSFPVTESTLEYTISNPFPATSGVSNYYAVPPNSGACYFAFTITVTNITSIPLVSSNLSYCQGDIALPLTATPTNPSYTLFYYQTPSSPPQLSITPSTASTGQTTYYVSEGISGSCISPNKAQIMVTVTPVAVAPISASSSRQNFCANDNGNIILSASGGSGTTLHWFSTSCGTASIGTGNNLAIPSPQITTTYYSRWENGCGNSNCAAVTVGVSDPISATATVTSPITCNGGTGTVTINFSGGASPYTCVFNGNPVSSNIITGISAGNYTWSVNDANNCGPVNGSISLSQPAPISATATSNSPICSGRNLYLYGVSSQAISWNWSGPNGFSSTLQNPVITGATLVNSGFYTLTISDGTCTTTNTVEVAINNDPIAVTGCSSNITECADTIVSGVLGKHVNWMLPDFSLNCLSGGASSSFFMGFELPEAKWNCWVFNRVQRIGNNSGVVNLWQSNGSGNPFILTPSVFIQPAMSVHMDLVCDPGKNFTWSLYLVQGTAENFVGSTFVNTTGNYAINIPSSFASGVYKMKFVFSGAGSNKCQVDNIFFDGLLMETGDCAGGIDFNVTGPIPGFFPVIHNYPIVYTATFNPISGNPIILNCSFNVTVEGVTGQFVSKTDASCSQNNGSITISAQSSSITTTSFSYANNGGAWVPFGVGVSQTSITGLSAGIYSIEVKDVSLTGDCIMLQPIVVTIIAHPAPVVNLYPASPLCINAAPYQLVFSPVGGTFSGNGVNQSGLFTASVAGTGTHSIVYSYTDLYGCTISKQIDIVVNELPLVTLDQAGPLCPNGSSIQLNGLPLGGIYSGSGVTSSGQFSPSLAGVGSHIITYTYTDLNNCYSSTQKTLIVIDNTAPIPSIPVLPVITGECSVTVSLVPTATDNCSGMLINGTTSDPLTYTSQGTYTITWTFNDGNGNTS